MSAAIGLPTLMAALMGVHLAGMGAFLTLPVLAPMIAAETGLPASLAGVHTALLYGGCLVSGPLTQGLVNRWGGVRTCQVALTGVAIGIAIAALGHPVALAASSFLSGIAHGPVTPTGSHLLAQRTPPHRRGLVFSIKQTGVPAGAMLVATLAPAVAVAAGWRAGVLTMAAMALVMACALQPLRRRLDQDRDPRAPVGWRGATSSLGLLRIHAGLRAVTVISACYGVAQFSVFSFFVVWQVEALGIDLVTAGLVLGLSQGAGIVARVFWGVVADRCGAPRVLGWIGVAIAVISGLIVIAGPGWPVGVIMAIGMAMGATAIGWNGALLAETARIAPSGQVGAATAALSFVLGLALVVAPAIQAALAEATGSYAPAFAGCAVLALVGAAFARPLARS